MRCGSRPAAPGRPARAAARASSSSANPSRPRTRRGLDGFAELLLARAAALAGRPGAAGLDPHLIDLVDQIQQLLGVIELERALDGRALLERLPAHVVQVRVLLEVLGLEVVAPQHADV